VYEAASEEFGSGNSVWRSFMNATIRQVKLSEPVLDLGAGRCGEESYHHLIPDFASLRSVALDIQVERRPTVKADAQGRLPFKAEVFSSCIALNLLEHVLLAEEMLEDVRRVLTRDGVFLIGVPFLHRVHADPSDYFRYTGYALEILLRRTGFTPQRVVACGTGPTMASLALVDFTVPRMLRRPAFHTARAIDALLGRRSGGEYRNEHDYPVGYVVLAASNG
jgi:SAM-dependent methyltransferase